MNDTITDKRRKLKVYHILIALLLIAAAAFALYKFSLRSKLQARIEAIYTAGYPVTLAELDQWYKIPDDAENAAYIILDAFEYYQEPQNSELLPVAGQAELPARTEPLPEETMKLVVQYLSDNQKALELLHEATAFKHSRYPVDFNLGFGTLAYHLSDIKRCALLLKLEAICYAEGENAQSAVQSIKSILGVARSLEKEPMTISQLVRIACQSIAVSTLERTLNRINLTDEQFAELEDDLTNVIDSSNMSCAFAGERCIVLSILKNPESLGPGIGPAVPSVPILFLYRTLGLAEDDAIIYLDLIDGYMNAAKLPPHQRQKAADAVEAKFKSTSKIHILLHVFMPAFNRIITIDLKNIAELRTALVSLVVQRYRLATGRLPETLKDLVPKYLEAVPTDPWAIMKKLLRNAVNVKLIAY